MLNNVNLPLKFKLVLMDILYLIINAIIVIFVQVIHQVVHHAKFYNVVQLLIK